MMETADKIMDLMNSIEYGFKDEYGNNITIPAGFRIVKNGESDVEYGYSGDASSPTVQDGIVIEDVEAGGAGNQFVWIPVGEGEKAIKDKEEGKKLLEKLELSENVRGESLKIEQFAQIANELCK